MSQESRRSGIAYHKAEQALSEVENLRRKLRAKGTSIAIMGFMLCASMIFLDEICQVLQIHYYEGWGIGQIIGFIVGLVMIFLGGI